MLKIAGTDAVVAALRSFPVCALVRYSLSEGGGYFEMYAYSLTVPGEREAEWFENGRPRDVVGDGRGWAGYLEGRFGGHWVHDLTLDAASAGGDAEEWYDRAECSAVDRLPGGKSF